MFRFNPPKVDLDCSVQFETITCQCLPSVANIFQSPRLRDMIPRLAILRKVGVEVGLRRVSVCNVL